MEIDPNVCWRASQSRDRRFDGLFFCGVVTTGVYCRPICPVSPPKRQNVRFYSSAASAEEAGFRPCRRCRPETAPGSPAWIGSSATVSRALRLICEGPPDPPGADHLAERLGIGSRHLRRLFSQHLGASPTAIVQTRRVHFARRLIDETELPITEVALSSGFRSIRQFNHSIRRTFGRPPTELRREARRRREQPVAGGVALKVPYRPPFDWDGTLAFLAARAIPGVEAVRDGMYCRVIELDGTPGMIELRRDAEAPQLHLRILTDNPKGLIQVVERVRRVFDLGADPLRIATDLKRAPEIAPYVEARPGARVPGAWDPFELAVRAVLGQQVSVKGATTLAGRLVRAFGAPFHIADVPTLTHVFPRPEVLAQADVSAIGMPRARAATISSLAAAVAKREIVLDSSRSHHDTIERLSRLPGIGEWTAQYIAMRALCEPDAFPASDLGLRRALANGAGRLTARQLLQMAESWRPWRAYAAMYLWTAEPATPNHEEELEWNCKSMK